jgi:hypothetical protein
MTRALRMELRTCRQVPIRIAHGLVGMRGCHEQAEKSQSQEAVDGGPDAPESDGHTFVSLFFVSVSNMNEFENFCRGLTLRDA